MFQYKRYCVGKVVWRTWRTLTQKVLVLHKKLDIQNYGLFMGFQKHIGFFQKKFKFFFSGPKTIFENCKISVFGPF